jgi:hypothetical protein
MDIIQSLLSGEIETYFRCDRYRSVITRNLDTFSSPSAQATSLTATFQHRPIDNLPPSPTIDTLVPKRNLSGTSDGTERNAQENL